MNITFLILFIFIIKIVFIFSENQINYDFECPRETPLFNIFSNSCVYERYDENKHIILNNIIKTQWLNRINPIGIEGFIIINSEISSNGDLIIESIPYSSETRFLYVIKSNGRALFYDEEKSDFIYQINVTTSHFKKSRSKLIKINLIGDDEKDYYISVSYCNNTIDIIDIYNKKINSLPQGEIFDFLNCYDFYILNLINEDKTYIFYSIEEKYNLNINYYDHYLSLQKFQFYNLDLSQNKNYKKLK